MTTSGQSAHDSLMNTLVERYVSEGFEVLKEPGPAVVPFDLGGYRPDLIAKKGGQQIIIEVKAQSERISFDRLRSVADEVRRHVGWRFVLVTGQDVEDAALPGQAEEPFSWDDVSHPLIATGAADTPLAQSLAFMGLWVAFERIMRFQARRITLPIDRLASPRTMIDQLYSHGELSAQQHETALKLVQVRNQVFHGVAVLGLSAGLDRLVALVRELREEWSRPDDERTGP